MASNSRIRRRGSKTGAAGEGAGEEFSSFSMGSCSVTKIFGHQGGFYDFCDFSQQPSMDHVYDIFRLKKLDPCGQDVPAME
jgi:hypothetical protein